MRGKEIRMELRIANALCNAVMEQFKVGESGIIFREYAPAKDGDRDSCFLFPYFALSGMLYHMIKAGETQWCSVYEKIMEGFVFYRADASKMAEGSIKYHSERGKEPGGGYASCFFDDNIWVARNFLFAYEILQKEEYLEEAKRIVNYTYTGWNDELGGLVWNDNGLTDEGTEQELERGLSANACCIIVNAMLYQITGEEGYLTWALRFYEFCKQMQDKDTGIYYNGVHTVIRDHVRYAGEINKDLYGYNAGSMILADLLLYDITGDESYKKDAVWAAKAVHQAFLKHDEVGRAYYKDFVWFTAIQAEGYDALARYDADSVEEGRKTLRDSLAFAWEHYRNADGLLPHDYVTGWRGDDDYDRLLLTHSGTAEIACLLGM